MPLYKLPQPISSLLVLHPKVNFLRWTLSTALRPLCYSSQAQTIWKGAKSLSSHVCSSTAAAYITILMLTVNMVHTPHTWRLAPHFVNKFALQQDCHDCSQKQTHDATGTLFEAVVLHPNKGAGLTAYCHACLCCSLGLNAGSIPATHNMLNASTQNCSCIADYRWSPIQVTPTRCQRSRPIHPCLGIVYILYLRQHMHGGQGSMDNRLHVCTRKSAFGHSQLAAEFLLQSCL